MKTKQLEKGGRFMSNIAWNVRLLAFVLAGRVMRAAVWGSAHTVDVW